MVKLLTVITATTSCNQIKQQSSSDIPHKSHLYIFSSITVKEEGQYGGVVVSTITSQAWSALIYPFTFQRHAH